MPVSLQPCENCYNELCDFRYDLICSTCREIKNQEARIKSKAEQRAKDKAAHKVFFNTPVFPGPSTDVYTYESSSNMTFTIKCMGCGKENAGDPCPECKGYMEHFAKEYEGWEAEEAKGNLRRTGNAFRKEPHPQGVSHKDYNLLQDALINSRRQVKEAHKKIEDLKSGIRELQEWADEKYNNAVDRIAKITEPTVRCLILTGKKDVYQEIGEHCAATLENNE